MIFTVTSLRGRPRHEIPGLILLRNDLHAVDRDSVDHGVKEHHTALGFLHALKLETLKLQIAAFLLFVLLRLLAFHLL